MAGTSYSLTCRVSLPSGVEPDSLDIQWVGLLTPQPVMISAGVYISNVNVTLNHLPPTTTSYICRASYTENGVSSRIVEDSISVNVVSKSASSQCWRCSFLLYRCVSVPDWVWVVLPTFLPAQ